MSPEKKILIGAVMLSVAIAGGMGFFAAGGEILADENAYSRSQPTEADRASQRSTTLQGNNTLNFDTPYRDLDNCLIGDFILCQ